jgi:hypothetical protein
MKTVEAVFAQRNDHVVESPFQPSSLTVSAYHTPGEESFGLNRSIIPVP